MKNIKKYLLVGVTMILAMPLMAMTQAALDEQLLEAAEELDLKSMTDLIAQGADVHAQNADGETALLLVAQKDTPEKSTPHCLALLLSKGANAIDGDPLLGLCMSFPQYDDLEMFKQCAEMLINNGADVNVDRKYESPPLCEVVRCRNSSTIIDFLVKQGADVNRRNFEGIQAIHRLAFEGRYAGTENLQALLRHGADINSADDKGRTLLHRLKIIGTWGVEDNFDDSEFTITQGIRDALAAGADPSVRDNEGRTSFDCTYESLLKASTCTDARELAKCLLLLNSDGKRFNTAVSALEFTILANNRDALQSVLVQGTSQNDRNKALHLAARLDEVECLNLLLQYGAEKECEINSVRPITVAVSCNSLSCVKALCDARINLEFYNEETEKPLDLVKSVECAEYLLKSGADIHYTNKGTTCLYPHIMHATENSRYPHHVELSTAIIKFLLSAGASVNEPCSPTMTPLGTLFNLLPSNLDSKNLLDLASLLLQNGAKIDCESTQGNSPLRNALHMPSDKNPSQWLDLLIRNSFWTFVPSKFELFQSRARIRTALLSMTHWKLPPYVQIYILLAGKGPVEQDVVFGLLGSLKKGNPNASHLLIRAKEAAVVYLTEKIQPLFERVRNHPQRGQLQPPKRALLEALLPRVPLLIREGLDQRFKELKKANPAQPNNSVLINTDQGPKKKLKVGGDCN